MPAKTDRYKFWLLSIILIALSVRLYQITYHSLWFDEAVSVHWAKQTVSRILEVGFTLEEDRLPPLYYLMLKGWTHLFGFSETAVRSLSVVFGVLLIPVAAGIASLLFNRRIALYTAALVAVNPFLIWYSQEARMYAQAAFFGTLAVWAFLRYCRTAGSSLQLTGNRQQAANHKQRVQPFRLHPSSFILLFILSATAGLYSHLYTGFLLPALGLWLIISYPRAWRLWLVFAVSGIVISLAYLPILLAIWRFSAEASPGHPLSGVAQRAWWLLHAFTVWKASLPSFINAAIPATTLLFSFFAYLNPKSKIQNPKSHTSHPTSRIPHPKPLITLLLIFPFVIASLLLYRNHLAFFGERYFIVMTPWLLMLAAVGAHNVGEWMNIRIYEYTNRRIGEYTNDRIGKWAVHHSFLATQGFIILFLLTLLPLPGQWTISAAKETWRQSVAYLARSAAPNHGILIHPDWVRYPFQYYFQGPGQTYAAFSTVTEATALDGPLQGVVGQHNVIWLIQSHIDSPDPERRVEQWFTARYPLVTELYPPGITLKAYAPGYQLDALPEEAVPTDIEFENGLKLAGYQADTTASATDSLFHPPSGWVHVTLYWTAAKPITEHVAPFVNLVGPEGVWGASLERSTDALKLFPPTRWPAPAPIIRHDLDINLNPATPAGTYQLVVGLHGQESRHPLTQVEVR